MLTEWQTLWTPIKLLFYNQFDLGLHCLLRQSSLNVWGKYDILNTASYSEKQALTISALLTTQNTCATSVDPDVMSRLIRIYTVCHSIIDFWMKTLFATMDVSKFRDRREHFRNSEVKGLTHLSSISSMNSSIINVGNTHYLFKGMLYRNQLN